MNDKSFERAMSQIASEAEAEQQRERQAAERRKSWNKIRQRCMFLFGVVAFGSGLYFRQDLQQYASKLGDKFSSSPTVKGETAAALSDLREGAAKRDQVLEDIAKSK